MRARVSTIVFAAALALAAPARADDAAARAAFRRGVDLYDKKQYAEALDAFREAYREKPSAIIKQNIALSLLGQGKKVEAATAFDEALEEGTSTLAPETRAAMERELGELSKVVATLDLHVVTAADHRPIADAVVRVDGAPLPPGALRRHIRLAPGIHVIATHVDGYADPPEKKLGFVAGAPVDATFEMGAAIGTVTLRPDVPGASIKIDGAIVGQGMWTGQLTAGPHRVEITAPDSRVIATEIVVTAGVAMDYPIVVPGAGETPPPYDVDRPPPPKPMRRWYIVASVGYHDENLQFSPELGENSGGTRRDVKGATFAIRGGYRLSRFFGAELHGELGTLSATYTADKDKSAETTTKVTSWQLTPAARFSTIGAVRFTTASGFGVHGLSLDSTPPPSTRGTKSGNAITPSWLLDFGLQVDVGSRAYLEGLLFFDVHGVGTLRDEVDNARLVLGSPAARVGVRIGFAWTF